jgi:flagellar biogenesis protein FliO
MPVDAIQPSQIIIMIAFLLFLVMVLFLVRRFRGGLSKHIHRTKRLRHIEDMALTPQQKLHLVEVDGQIFIIHTGKGHAATMVPVGGAGETPPPMTLMDVQPPRHQTARPQGNSRPHAHNPPQAHNPTQAQPHKSTQTRAQAQAYTGSQNQAQAAAAPKPAPAAPTRQQTSVDQAGQEARPTSASVDQIANAIAEARRRNPSLGLDK